MAWLRRRTDNRDAGTARPTPVLDYLKRVMSMADELGIGIHIHLAETMTEYNDIKAQYGKTPIALMEEIGLFERPVLAAHCVVLDDEDIGILARRKVACP